MKNIHVLPTDKPSKFIYSTKYNKFMFCYEAPFFLDDTQAEHKGIYITSDEEIKEGDWVLNTNTNSIAKYTGHGSMDWWVKIILTTDTELIKDGVQAIDDEFLEWFVKNPSCESVEVEVDLSKHNGQFQTKYGWKIIIPQEEPKQETLEEVYLRNIQEYAEQNLHHKETVEKAAEKHWKMQYIMALDESIKPYIIEDFIAGAKSDAARDYWFEQFNNKQQKQAKTMYSEEELLEFGKLVLDTFHSEGKTKSGKDRLARVKFNKWFEQFKKK
jgi:hypothetical protein